MKFCSKCGQEIDDNAIFCHRCGNRTNGDNPTRSPFGFDPYGGGYGYADTRESKGIQVLSFFFWQVGAILWLTWRRTRPGYARSAMKGTVASLCFSMPIIGLVLWFLWRRDPDNREIARIGGIAAIVGASLVLLSSFLLVLLTSWGLISPDMINDFLTDPSAALIVSGFLG